MKVITNITQIIATSWRARGPLIPKIQPLTGICVQPYTFIQKFVLGMTNFTKNLGRGWNFSWIASVLISKDVWWSVSLFALQEVKFQELPFHGSSHQSFLPVSCRASSNWFCFLPPSSAISYSEGFTLCSSGSRRNSCTGRGARHPGDTGMAQHQYCNHSTTTTITSWYNNTALLRNYEAELSLTGGNNQKETGDLKDIRRDWRKERDRFRFLSDGKYEKGTTYVDESSRLVGAILYSNQSYLWVTWQTCRPLNQLWIVAVRIVFHFAEPQVMWSWTSTLLLLLCIRMCAMYPEKLGELYAGKVLKFGSELLFYLQIWTFETCMGWGRSYPSLPSFLPSLPFGLASRSAIQELQHMWVLCCVSTRGCLLCFRASLQTFKCCSWKPVATKRPVRPFVSWLLVGVTGYCRQFRKHALALQPAQTQGKFTRPRLRVVQQEKC